MMTSVVRELRRSASGGAAAFAAVDCVEGRATSVYTGRSTRLFWTVVVLREHCISTCNPGTRFPILKALAASKPLRLSS
jgi:hypothetical protein